MKIFISLSAIVLWIAYDLSIGTYAFARGGKRTPFEHYAVSPPKSPEKIESNITWSPDGDILINYAGISTPDSLSSCPIEPLPSNLEQTVNQLVETVRSSVTIMEGTHGKKCTGLQNEFDSTQSMVGTALQYQLIAGNSVTADAKQDQINRATQQASALNVLILTASNLLHHECVESIDKRIMIQKLIGQVITLGGLFIGGWQGVATAAGGQLIGNLPLFSDPLQKALEGFQKYDERKELSNFFCRYRQIRKTSCLLFATEDDTVIAGLDTRFQNGPAKVTQDSVEEFKRDPSLSLMLKDVEALYDLEKTTSKFMSLEGSTEAIETGPMEAYNELLRWCKSRLQPFLHPIHENEKQKDLAALIEVCNDLKGPKKSVRTRETRINTLSDSYWNIHALLDYYSQLKDDEKRLKLDLESLALEIPTADVEKKEHDLIDLGHVANTFESLKYYYGLRASVEEFRDSEDGNQARMDYRSLTEHLGSGLVRRSLHEVISRDYTTLAQHSLFPWNSSTDIRVRRTALRAMLDLCKTFDPTLACLYIGNPEHNKLHRQWITSCLGPNSYLCYSVKPRDKETLLDDPNYAAYFNSLCDSKGAKGERGERSS